MFHLPLISTLFPYTTLFRSSLAKLGCNRFRHFGRNHVQRFREGVTGRQSTAHKIECVRKQLKESLHSLLALAHHVHEGQDRKSTRLNSSHLVISYAVFCLKK